VFYQISVDTVTDYLKSESRYRADSDICFPSKTSSDQVSALATPRKAEPWPGWPGCLQVRSHLKIGMCFLREGTLSTPARQEQGRRGQGRNLRNPLPTHPRYNHVSPWIMALLRAPAVVDSFYPRIPCTLILTSGPKFVVVLVGHVRVSGPRTSPCLYPYLLPMYLPKCRVGLCVMSTPF